MPGFKPPENFDFSKPNEWPDWRKRFSRFRIATELHKKDADVQVSQLLYIMGEPTAENIYDTFIWAPAANGNAAENREDYDTVIRKFNEYFIPQKNLPHERNMFNRRDQIAGENNEMYIRTIYTMVERCEYPANLKEEMIRDRLLAGMSDKRMASELILKDNLTCSMVINEMRSTEVVRQQQQSVAAAAIVPDTPPVLPSNIEAVGYNHPSASNQRGRGWNNYSRPWRGSRGRVGRGRGGQSRFQDNNNTKCNKCGYWQHTISGVCPASNVRCNKCYRTGHYERCCQNDEVSACGFVYNNDTVESINNEYQDAFLGSIQSQNDKNGDKTHVEVDYIMDPEIYTVEQIDDDDSPWHINLNVGNTEVPFKIDCGADVSTMSESVYASLTNKPNLRKSDRRLKSASGTLACLGCFTAHIKHNNTNYAFTVYVVDSGGGNTSLLSRSVSQRLNLIKRVDSIVDSSVFGPIGKIKCEPVKIELAPGAVPHCIHTSYRVPIPLMPKALDEIERMKGLNVIRLVEKPTTWCTSAVVIEKPNGDVRFCVDMRKLNKFVLRQKYTLPTADDVLSNLAGSEFYTKLDASAGYWGMPLDEESQLLTTFIGPDGNRYCFQVLPFGISSASEIFQYQMSKILKGVANVEVFQDDILVHGKTKQEHDVALAEVIRRLKAAGVKLNKRKCVFCVRQLVFVGHQVSGKGIGPDPAKIEGIADMPEPQDVSGLKRVNGVIQYLSKFIPRLADHMQPMNELLKSDVKWHWGPPQAEAFKKIKELIVSSKVLAHYDMNKTTVVSADASSYGIGGVLLQQHEKGLLPIAFCSRTLTDAEKNYAQIEKECLAIVWTCEKLQRFLKGLKVFTIHTDHKPLVPLINNKDLHKVPLRCQRLLMRLMAFNPVAAHIPGKELVIADALSRSPRPTTKEAYTVDDVEAYVSSVTETLPMTKQKLAQYQRETASDETLVAVKKYIEDGWPRYIDKVPNNLHVYYEAQGELSTCSGLVLIGSRIVVPKPLQTEVTNIVHEGHIGFSKSFDRANEYVWWPDMRRDIAEKCAKCDFCQIHKPAQRKEPLVPTPMPSRPWSKISMDFFSGAQYLVVSDYYSRWIEILKTPVPSCEAIIPKLRALFSTFGNPDEIVSDNSPFNSVRFDEFCTSMDIFHDTSSPRHPQSNGQAESAVKSAKRIMEQDDPMAALQAYRASPISATGYSPAELMLGRKIRTKLPCVASKLKPRTPDSDTVKSNDAKIKSQYKRSYDARHGARELSQLKPGDKVRVKPDDHKLWSEPMTVVDKHDNHPRSYNVMSRTGAVYRRNRRHIQAIPHSDNDDEISDDEVEPEVRVVNQPPHIPRQSGRVIRPVNRLIETCSVCQNLL